MADVDTAQKNPGAMVCAGCGLDVTHVPHVTASQGRYFCNSCHAYHVETTANPPVVRHQPIVPKPSPPAEPDPVPNRAPVSESAAIPVPPTAAADADIYALADEPPADPTSKPAFDRTAEPGSAAPAAKAKPIELDSPEDSEKFTEFVGCADCRNIFLEDQVSYIDGAFLCAQCAAKRPAAPPEEHAEAPADRDVDAAKASAAMDSLRFKLRAFAPAARWSAVLAAGAFVILLVVIFGFHIDPLSIFYATRERLPLTVGTAAALVLTFTTMAQATLLLVSMIIADQLFGGLDFGKLEHAMAKAVVITLCGNTVGFLIPGLLWGILYLFIRPTIFLVGLVALFRLAKVEAVVVSIANSVLTLILLMFAGILFWHLFGPELLKAAHSSAVTGSSAAKQMQKLKGIIQQG